MAFLISIPAASAASHVVYDSFVCLSTCRRNRPPSGRLGCVTSSSASGAIVIILVPCRVVATMILLSSLRVSQNQQPQGCPVVGFSSSGASAASGDVAARAVIEGIGPDHRGEVWHSGRWDQKHSSIRQQESRGDRTNVSTCVGIGLTKSSTMASADVGSKKRSVLRNLLSQPARSASNQGELHASFLTQTCARCNGFARNRRAVTSHRARAVTCCQGARNKRDFQGADRKRTFRQKMDGRAADRQLQGPDRQAGDQAAAGHLLRSA